MDNNWVLLLFTSCTWLILKCLLVACMGTYEACTFTPSIHLYIVILTFHAFQLVEVTMNISLVSTLRTHGGLDIDTLRWSKKIVDWTSKAWDSQTQNFVVGCPLIAETLSKVHILAKRIYVWHVQPSIITNHFVMQYVIVSTNRIMQKIEKKYCGNSRPPTLVLQWRKKLKDSTSEKRKFKLHKKLSKSQLLCGYHLFFFLSLFGYHPFISTFWYKIYKRT